MKTHHTLISLHMPRTHADFMVYVDHILASMTNNPHFPNAGPELAAAKAHLDGLRAAHTAAQSHAKGTADARDLELHAVMTHVHNLAGMVQRAADANPAEGAAIISSSGLGTRVHGVHARPELSAQMGPGGVVVLHAHSAGRSAVYEWSYSSDGGHTFTSLPPTRAAHTHVGGLTLGTTYVFRVRAESSGAGEAHETTFIVH